MGFNVDSQILFWKGRDSARAPGRKSVSGSVCFLSLALFGFFGILVLFANLFCSDFLDLQ